MTPARARAQGLAQEFRPHRDHPRRRRWRSQGERVGVIGPNGAGKSHAVQPDQRPPAPTSGRILLNGERIDGLAPYEINRRAWRAASRSATSSRGCRVFENLRCSVLWSLGYRYSFWKFLSDLRDANERAEELMR
jgi:branched-chain amino acid transport system ATP-binding protein